MPHPAGFEFRDTNLDSDCHLSDGFEKQISDHERLIYGLKIRRIISNTILIMIKHKTKVKIKYQIHQSSNDDHGA